jgi:DNA-binding response OmpR family regulator
LTQPPSVLVVDDDEAARRLFAAILGQAKCRVTTAPDGWSALKLLTDGVARGTLPDVVVLDLDMPYLNGDALMSAVARHTGMAGIPIIVVTAHTDVRLSNVGFALLEKPVDSGDLVDAVRAAARRRASA